MLGYCFLLVLRCLTTCTLSNAYNCESRRDGGVYTIETLGAKLFGPRCGLTVPCGWAHAATGMEATANLLRLYVPSTIPATICNCWNEVSSKAQTVMPDTILHRVALRGGVRLDRRISSRAARQLG
jgi:hypothetical protein